MPRHVLIKHKERTLKSAREKQQVTYKANSIHIRANHSGKTLQARREWQGVYKVLKGKNLQPRLLYLAKISLKINGEIKSFSTSKSEENSVPPNQLQNKCKRDLYSQEIQEKKKDLQNQPQRIKKMAIGKYISITLNVNGLNDPMKRHCLAAWVQK